MGRIKGSIITVDGPAGAGKSTVSRLLAKELDFFYLDTGAMYRAAASEAGRQGIAFEDGPALSEMCKEIDLRFVSDGEGQKVFIGERDISSEIRLPEMDMLSSRISAIREVREAMKDLQRKIGKQGGLVAEGRDMGTEVFPDADWKFFITASPEIRAGRRYEERLHRGESISRGEVDADMRKRDEQDKTRRLAPLRPAEDAEIIDTSDLDIKQVVKKIINKIKTGNAYRKES